MGQFIHNPNNQIIIIDNSGNQSVYDDAWWIANEEPAYSLPVGAILQYYRQSDARRWHDASGNVTEESIPWADGDTYISNKATYDANYLIYTLGTVQNAKDYQIGKLNLYWSGIKNNANVVYLGTTYFSNSYLREQWKEELEYANRNTLLLSSHYVRDIADNENNMDIATLNEFIDEIDEFYWETKKIRDDHIDAINLLADIPTILAYDYTTNWPLTPFDNGMTLNASYESSINADYAGGSATGSATGGAAIAASYLDLAHDDARYVDYDGTANVDNQQTGSIIFTVKPNYSGAPTADRVFFSISKADADSINLIQLTHKITTGNLQLDLKDSSDVSIASINFGAWSPTSGTDYKISVHYDITAGEIWLKIDDIQFGAINTSTGTRDANIDLLRVGSGYNSGAAESSDFSIKLLHVSSK